MDTTSQLRIRSERTVCSECGHPLSFTDRVLVGEVLSCDRCDKTLEVVGIEPVALAPLAKIEEEEEDFTDF